MARVRAEAGSGKIALGISGTIVIVAFSLFTFPLIICIFPVFSATFTTYSGLHKTTRILDARTA